MHRKTDKREVACLLAVFWSSFSPHDPTAGVLAVTPPSLPSLCWCCALARMEPILLVRWEVA